MRPEGGPPRPGDAARAALRRGTPAPEAEAAGTPPTATPTTTSAPAGPTGTGGHGAQAGSRPGDAARAALRAALAARDEACRTDAPATDDRPDTEPPRREAPARTAALRRRGTPETGSLRDPAVVRRPGSVPDPVSGPVPRSASGAGQETGSLRDPAVVRRPGSVPDPVSGPVPESASGAGQGAGSLRDLTVVRRPGPVPQSASGLGQEAVSPRDPAVVRRPGSVPEPVSGLGPGPISGLAQGPTAGHAPEPGPAVPAQEAPHPTAPHPVAPSMAAPHRDTDLRRTFPPFRDRDRDRTRPAPPGGGPAEDAPLAETWWGNAWVAALEEGALDVGRLVRGRGYATGGHVDAITVTPGLVLAYVQGSRPRPYRVQVRLRTLEDTDWDRFLDAAAERPAHIAALLDKELPPSLADGAVPLLPGPGELEPHCSCPDRGHPCKHAAALCYQTARLLDADPFVLLLLRGRGERALLDALSRRNATAAARAAQEREPAGPPGVRATEVLARRQRPPLPAPLPPLAHPEQPPAYPAAPGGPDPLALDQLATDAAARAHALLATGHDPVGELTLWQDAVRLAAARPGSGLTAAGRALYASLASVTGRTPADLARAVAAWRQGGPEALAVLEEPWDPPAGRFDRARPLLLAAGFPAFRPTGNRLTHPRGHVQLRFGRDGLWYAYESEPGADDWWPRGTPDHDPVGALTGTGTAQEPFVRPSDPSPAVMNGR
ncbi:SWIM zinc finger family protein [Streptomyces sp. NPDC093094]|uniref:SWIM zinc finger family protein n=1 Tax=Streptomyces sp. NPDC093094 TaxID=3366026 RepID=UPI003800B74C